MWCVCRGCLGEEGSFLLRLWIVELPRSVGGCALISLSDTQPVAAFSASCYRVLGCY